jgi:hypothetical protein
MKVYLEGYPYFYPQALNTSPQKIVAGVDREAS